MWAPPWEGPRTIPFLFPITNGSAVGPRGGSVFRDLNLIGFGLFSVSGVILKSS
jgi:hypothetical protein